MLTLTIVVTVGLGVGATTAIFSAVDAALLRPLPVAPDQAGWSASTRMRRRSSSAFSVGGLPGARSTADAFPAGCRSTKAARDGLQRRHRPRIWCRGALYRGPTFSCSVSRQSSAGRSPKPDGRQNSPQVGHRQSRLLAAASRRPRRRDRSGHSSGRHRLQPGRRAAAGCRTAGTAPGIFRGGTMAAAAAAGPVLHHRARPVAERIGPIRRGRRPSRDQPKDVSCLEGLVSGRAGDVGDDGLAIVRCRRRADDCRPRAGCGCSGVDDRVRERVQSADRARERAGGGNCRSARRSGASRSRVVRHLLTESGLLAMGAASVGIGAGVGGHSLPARGRRRLPAADARNRD